MKLIALKDLSDQTKAGDVFEAPDAILVAVGLAKHAEDETPRPARRRYLRRDLRAEA